MLMYVKRCEIVLNTESCNYVADIVTGTVSTDTASTLPLHCLHNFGLAVSIFADFFLISFRFYKGPLYREECFATYSNLWPGQSPSSSRIHGVVLVLN